MIYTLPGMGANSNMYSGPWLEIQNIKFLDWPIYHGEKTLSEVADRIISENNISQSDSVAGSSLGGMVALEIANKLRVENVFLFGSAVAKTEINPLLRLLSPIAEVTPIKFIQTIAGKYH
jgi:pimeloyl-ACP methyl ester carboxylesterase